ncbi:MAG TPA: alanine--tRNA ligase, partial [Methylomirabilota bacterium]|nr:alanine--tRNA ligase [Methylomirabilota bacterium]
DGVTPSNEWRGYVLRRIMRRAMRHGRMLGLTNPFLCEVTATVCDIMGVAYPEVSENGERITQTVLQEEERFAETLDLGMVKIREYLEAHAGEGRKVVDGRFLFTLYDTHGFPTDLAQEVFQDSGWAVTEETLRVFEAEMEAQRERARAGGAFRAEPAAEAGALYTAVPQQFGAQRFLGYECLTSPARIWVIIGEGEWARRREARQGETVEVILDQTPGYAESGGQIGDTGQIVGREGRGDVLDTYYRGPKVIVHRVRVTQGGLRENDDVAVSVDSRRRQGLRLHHTGTHLLHAALRKVLGSHVTQAGSLVAPDHLRFDFSHGAAMKDTEVEQVEDLVNEQVQANIVVAPAEMDLQQALRRGALALFGEKYGDRVRVIRIGDFSTELCGGTHLDATGQIGLFKVVTEGAVASGVRRIEAVTGPEALRHVGREEAALRESAGLLKIAPLELPRRLQKLLDEQKALEKQLEQLEARLARERAQELVSAAKQVGGVAVIAHRLDGLDAEGLRSVADTLRQRLGSGVICLGSVMDGKVSLVASVSKDLTGRFQAGRLIQEVARAVGGKGGGRPDLAQGGGPDPSKLDDALALVSGWVERAAKT